MSDRVLEDEDISAAAAAPRRKHHAGFQKALQKLIQHELKSNASRESKNEIGSSFIANGDPLIPVIDALIYGVQATICVPSKRISHKVIVSVSSRNFNRLHMTELPSGKAMTLSFT